jgi:hypothetical protein
VIRVAQEGFSAFSIVVQVGESGRAVENPEQVVPVVPGVAEVLLYLNDPVLRGGILTRGKKLIRTLTPTIRLAEGPTNSAVGAPAKTTVRRRSGWWDEPAESFA